MNFLYQVLANFYDSTTQTLQPDVQTSENVLRNENLKPSELGTWVVKKAAWRGYTPWKTNNKDFISSQYRYTYFSLKIRFGAKSGMSVPKLLGQMWRHKLEFHIKLVQSSNHF